MFTQLSFVHHWQQVLYTKPRVFLVVALPSYTSYTFEYIRIFYPLLFFFTTSRMSRLQRHDEDLDSEFDQSERRLARQNDPLLRDKPVHAPQHSAAVASKHVLTEERDKEEWRARRFHLLSMDAYSRHKASAYSPPLCTLDSITEKWWYF